ncbi:hypothetical protein OLX02_03390 [Novosphingobium sp. KCTC 2891]|uniref:hypothetical protein n=1 Tax=Novosphingobium sp. KCTC 2891 TaxID=2989730 RepID=UPI002221A3B1|nr:hypothetical protein [Novosphingobium sp. KCTC 2891]MCW1381860.1 hypothetical protein [Novosphingobium sp. KCTC 2891]
MEPSQLPASPSRYGASPRNRPVSLALAVAITLLLALIVVRMGDYTEFGAPGRGHLVAISLSKGAGEEAKASRAPQKQDAAHDTARATRAVPHVQPPRIVIPTPHATLPPDFVVMSRKDFASNDIGRIAPAQGSAGQGGADRGGGAAGGVGEGPGGATLYAAQWYREPNNAEIGPYLPTFREPGSWAMIACRTIQAYHVEDCREMDESPRGSGLARALRLASWQFLVRPPRIDGKPQLGTWVKIRFDFNKAKGEDAG